MKIKIIVFKKCNKFWIRKEKEIKGKFRGEMDGRKNVKKIRMLLRSYC